MFAYFLDLCSLYGSVLSVVWYARRLRGACGYFVNLKICRLDLSEVLIGIKLCACVHNRRDECTCVLCIVFFKKLLNKKLCVTSSLINTGLMHLFRVSSFDGFSGLL